MHFRCTLSKKKAGSKSLHHTQSYRNAAGSSNPWLSLCSIVPATGFDPETRNPEFLWLSRYRCAEPEAQSLKPREWNSDPGTRAGSRLLEEAGISLGMHGEDWRISCFSSCILLGGAGPRRSRDFYWQRRRTGAGPSEDGERAAGGGMKRLRKQTGKCRRAAVLGSATVQVGLLLRSGAAVSGFREYWRVGRWPCGTKVELLATGEAGDAEAQVLPGNYSLPGVRATGRWSAGTRES